MSSFRDSAPVISLISLRPRAAGSEAEDSWQKKSRVGLKRWNRREGSRVEAVTLEAARVDLKCKRVSQIYMVAKIRDQHYSEAPAANPHAQRLPLARWMLGTTFLTHTSP